MNVKRFTRKLMHLPEPVQIYTGKYGYFQLYVPTSTYEEHILQIFETEYGTGVVSLKQRLDFANKISSNGAYSKELILKVISSKKN